MPELRLIAEDTRGPIDVFTRWLPRVAVALAFVSIGYEKFAPHSMWVRLFNDIGVGQWLRYLTGVMQIGGGALVLIPATFHVGIAMLATTMAGAMVVWIFVLHHGLNAIIPGTLLAILIVVGMRRR